jgi:hypothetical protein
MVQMMSKVALQFAFLKRQQGIDEYRETLPLSPENTFP